MFTGLAVALFTASAVFGAPVEFPSPSASSPAPACNIAFGTNATALNGTAFNSTLFNSTLFNSTLFNSTLFNSTLFNATLFNSTLNSTSCNFTLDGDFVEAAEFSGTSTTIVSSIAPARTTSKKTSSSSTEAPSTSTTPTHTSTTSTTSTEATSTSTTSTSTSAAAATSTSASTYSGRATYYTVTGSTGACGWDNTDSELVVALNKPQFNPDSDGFSDYCGYSVVITNTDNGNQYTAKVVDECPECATGSLDMSPTLFGKLSDEDYDEGVFPITWYFESS